MLQHGPRCTTYCCSLVFCYLQDDIAKLAIFAQLGQALQRSMIELLVEDEHGRRLELVVGPFVLRLDAVQHRVVQAVVHVQAAVGLLRRPLPVGCAHRHLGASELCNCVENHMKITALTSTMHFINIT